MTGFLAEEDALNLRGMPAPSGLRAMALPVECLGDTPQASTAVPKVLHTLDDCLLDRFGHQAASISDISERDLATDEPTVCLLRLLALTKTHDDRVFVEFSQDAAHFPHRFSHWIVGIVLA